MSISLQYSLNPLDKRSMSELVNNSLQIIEEHESRIPVADTLSIEVSPPSPIRIVRLWRSHAITKHSCKPITSGWVPTINSKDIQSEIDRKNEIVPENKYNCDELILVIEVRGGKISSYSSMDGDVENDKYHTTYNKCVLMYDDTRVIELALA